MKHRSIISAFALVFMACTMAAQNPIGPFVASISESCTDIEYSFTTIADVPVKGSGTVKIQGDSFIMRGGGLEVWCDGKTSWTIDREAEELIIAPIDSGTSASRTNPALMLGTIDKYFTVKTMESVTESGVKVQKLELLPISDQTGIKFLTIWLKADGTSITKAEMETDDGVGMVFEFQSIKFLPKISEDTFVFNDKNLGKSWVVTDLR